MERSQREPPEPSGGLILVADDDFQIQEVLKTKLSRSGYRVMLAGDGDEVFSKIAEQMPDLLILDVKMPKIDGFEVCRILRENAATQGLPILMLTAYGGVDYIVKGLEAGADDYVTKPFHIEEVEVRVRSLLRMKQIERELRDKETRLARIDTVGQLLVTMAHYINNALAVLNGRAQAVDVNDPQQAEKLKESCLKQTQRIKAVLDSLKTMAVQMNISTTSYAGLEDAMLDIEKDIKRRFRDLEGEE